MSSYYTEEELVERYKFYTLELESIFADGEDFKTVGEQVPVSIHRNDTATLRMLDFNDLTLKYIGYSREELDELGAKYFEKHMHPYNREVTSKQVVKAALKNPSRVIGYIEYIHVFADEKEYKPVLSFLKLGETDPTKALALSMIPQMFYNSEMPQKMERIIEMDEFKFNHFKRFQQLTKREKQILKLLAEGQNNPKIANQLFISRQTVETHRKHINRKLDIKHYRDVLQYALAFDLISIA